MNKSIDDNFKPDSRQWLPVYGIYQMHKDSLVDRPLIIDTTDYSKAYKIVVWHALSASAIAAGAMLYISNPEKAQSIVSYISNLF